MERIYAAILCLFALPTFSQLEGDIKKDNRKIIAELPFAMKSSHEGVVVFKIAVNPKGEITAADIIEEKTTLSSTPAKIKARNYVMRFSFESGTHYPKFHQGEIRLTLSKNRKED